MGLFKYTLLNRHRTATASRLASAAGAVLLATAPILSMAAQPDESNAVSVSDEPPAMAVSYGDLNLATEDGARALLLRIRLAADSVCPAADNRELARLKVHNRCVHVAIARAVQQVGSPHLAALYSMRTPHG